jgi:hypothetical protein
VEGEAPYFSSFFSSSRFLKTWTGSGLCDRDYMAGFLDAWWTLFEARKFEVEVASGENWSWHLKQLSE